MSGKGVMKQIVHIDPGLIIEDIEDVLKLPVIIRVNEFEEEDLEDFDKDFSEAHNTGQPIIPIIIDSYGGSAYGVLGMISSIENSRLPVATIVTSKIMSAGTILFAFGTEGYRFIDPHAQVMLHDISSISYGKIEDLKVDVKHAEHLNTMLYKRMAKHLGHNEDYFLKLLKNHRHVDIFMTAKEAKNHRIANHLRIPSLDIAIKLEMSLN
jgi:ATP-dependent Clp protease, protease subunit